jgi:small-conductance mechanosensitive channel
MSDFLQFWGLDKVLSDLPHAMLAQIRTPAFLVQFAAIALAAGLAFWLGYVVRPALGRWAGKVLPQSWVPSFTRVGQAMAAPLLWLSLLWLAGICADLAGLRAPLVEAGIELLAAWVIIRLLSFSVKSPAAAMTISFLVWSLAALSILGLLDTVVHHLESSALHLGKYRLSALTVLHAVFALGVLLWLTLLLFRFLQRQIMRATSLTPSLKVLFVQLMQILLPALAVVTALSAAGVNLTALTVISGAVFLGIGLGLQKLVGNLVAGLTLLVGKSIKPGDVIGYKDGFGRVTEMGARYVTLRKLDGSEHLVPNEYFLENGVENWSLSDNRVGLAIPIGISYASDLRKALALAVEAAMAVPRVLKDPPPISVVKGFGDSSVDLAIYVSIVDPEKGTANVKSDVLLEVWDRFAAAGIQFPFPQRDVHILSMPGRT